MSFKTQAWQPHEWTVTDVEDELTFTDLRAGDILSFEGNGLAGTGSLTRERAGTPSPGWATYRLLQTSGEDRVHLTHVRTGRGFTVIRKASSGAKAVLECWPGHFLGDLAATYALFTSPSWTAEQGG